MSDNQIYYLSSLESDRFKPVRKCRFLKQIYFDTGKECALVNVSPSINGQDFGVNNDIDVLILTSRHEGVTLFPVSEFPCFVFIVRSLLPSVESIEYITKKDVEIIGWGEIYRSYHDAENHVFDK